MSIFKVKSQTIVYTCKKTKAGIFQFLVASYLSVQETLFYLASHLLRHLWFLCFWKEDLGTCCCHFVCAFFRILNDSPEIMGSSSACKCITPFYPQDFLAFLSFLNIHRPIPNKAPVDLTGSISTKHVHTSCTLLPTYMGQTRWVCQAHRKLRRALLFLNDWWF